jgi:hypothetical protein
MSRDQQRRVVCAWGDARMRRGAGRPILGRVANDVMPTLLLSERICRTQTV